MSTTTRPDSMSALQRFPGQRSAPQLPRRRTTTSAVARLRRIGQLALGATALAFPALAADGVLEINQTCAVQTGCLPGDLPGFPVQIATPTSVVLTSNLDVTVAPNGTAPDTSAIEVTTGVVGTSIDLNGFSIIGPASCSFAPPCTNTGSGIGVGGVASVRNGSVRGMGSDGVAVSGDVAAIRSTGNGGNGISTSFGNVSRVFAAINGGVGISVSGGTVEHSVSVQNHGEGIRLTRSSGENLTLQSNQGAEANLLDSRLGHSLLRTNAAGDLVCSQCSITGCQLTDCVGAACFGAGTIVQTPPGSNLCGNVVCP